MLKVTNLEDLTALPIPLTLQDQIKFILFEPFNDEAEAQQVWGELQCELWFLTSISDLSADGVDGTDAMLLKQALTYTEFEDELELDMVLTLSIVEDRGKGIYLLMTKTLLAELRQHFSITDE